MEGKNISPEEQVKIDGLIKFMKGINPQELDLQAMACFPQSYYKIKEKRKSDEAKKSAEMMKSEKIKKYVTLYIQEIKDTIKRLEQEELRSRLAFEKNEKRK